MLRLVRSTGVARVVTSRAHQSKRVLRLPNALATITRFLQELFKNDTLEATGLKTARFRCSAKVLVSIVWWPPNKWHQKGHLGLPVNCYLSTVTRPCPTGTATSLRAYNLAVYSLGAYSLGLPILGLGTHSLDWEPTVKESRVWEFKI